MRRYILTGTPGAGKTAILRWLETEDVPVVEEAATDVIALEQAQGRAEPHTSPDFIDAIVRLQRHRRIMASARPDAVQVHDRSPICTYALSQLLGYPISPLLAEELAMIEALGAYQRRVLFVDNLGYVTPTAARRINSEDAVRFEALHEAAYLQFGYELVRIAPGPLAERAAAVRAAISSPFPPLPVSGQPV